MMDEAMKLAGLHYLHNTLRPSLDLVFQEHKPCEIDPTRVKDLAAIQTNLDNLKEYVENIFQAITTSALHCPGLMCQMFHDLKELASRHFPGQLFWYVVVSLFVFMELYRLWFSRGSTNTSQCMTCVTPSYNCDCLACYNIRI